MTGLLLFVLFPLFSGPVDLTSAERSWLEEHPVIRLGVGTSFPPIQYVTTENGQYQFLGITSDYLDLISSMLGVEFEIQYGITFAEALEKGRNREIDMFPCLAYSTERDTFLDFTEGYLENPIVIFANEDAPFISSVQDLSGLRVADVEALYIYKELKRDVPGIDFVFTDNAEECLEAVAFGRADANVAGLIFGSYIIRKNSWTNIKVAAPSDYPNTVFRMAVRDDWNEFCTILNKALAAIDQQTKNEINRKWIAVRYEYGISSQDVIRRTGLTAGISAAVLAVIMIWVFRLRMEIKRRRQAEVSLSASREQLKQSVREKDLLMHEVEHRIKNNLSLVSSMLQLQASELRDPIDAEKIQTVAVRLQSMIILHDKLSTSGDMTGVDVEDYMSELIEGIISSRDDTSSKIEIRWQAIERKFPSRVIIPLGLIITELVTNAYKYAFPDGSGGIINIVFGEDQPNHFILRAENNGVPLPEEFDIAKAGTLGLNLVQGLAEQIGGSLSIIGSPHPVFTISFGIEAAE